MKKEGKKEKERIKGIRKGMKENNGGKERVPENGLYIFV